MLKRRQARFSISPRTTLAVTLVAALLVLAGGIRLARHMEQVHQPGDRKPVQMAGEEVEKQFGQLERLYAKHLRQLVAATATMSDQSAIADACSSIVGVQQWSLIRASDVNDAGWHVPVGAPGRNPLPQPTFQMKAEGIGPNDLLLSKEELFQVEGPTWGWIADPGKPLLFWQRADLRSDRVVVLMIDTQAVREALDSWMAQQANKAFLPLDVRNGAICALESSGRSLASTGDLPRSEPDFILPIQSLFGAWEMIAWDRVTTRVVYDFKTLAVAGFLAVLIVMLGVVAFLQQARLLAQTAQRVTFINRVSHELRSPLTNILLNLDLSLESMGDRQIHRLGLVQEEALRLRRLVDNVLTFSSMEQKKRPFKAQRCVPDRVIEGVMGQFAPAFARRSIRATYRGGAADSCLLDADALTQILGNLFSNVEKYAPNGPAMIEAEQRMGFLTITVSDAGPGISSAEAERIFQPFQRIDGSINEGATGTGLGLSIARDLALGMGGSLRLVSAGSGAIFELRVPAPRSDPTGDETP